MGLTSALTARAGRRLAKFLAAPAHVHGTAPATRLALFLDRLMPADVVLVEGNSRFSTAIKYLTQSTWSHAAMYVGERALAPDQPPQPCFIEADVIDGVRCVGTGEFAGYHLRICRATGLNDADRAAIIAFMVARLGHQYDLKNIADLVRYLLPTPPVPLRLRRKLLTLGSGDPTRAICSTLVARAFQSIRYPILPMVHEVSDATPDCPDCRAEILAARESSFFVPRDFDVSPYFEVIKPSLPGAFDHRQLRWVDAPAG